MFLHKQQTGLVLLVDPLLSGLKSNGLFEFVNGLMVSGGVNRASTYLAFDTWRGPS